MTHPDAQCHLCGIKRRETMLYGSLSMPDTCGSCMDKMKGFEPDPNLDKDDDYQGMEQCQPTLWLESEDDEDYAVSADGHIYLSRAFRHSDDPAVLLSKTMLAAPELKACLEQLVKVTDMVDTVIAFPKPLQQARREAVLLLGKLSEKTP